MTQLRLPHDFSERSTSSRSLSRLALQIWDPTESTLRRLCETQNATLLEAAVAVLAALLSRYGALTDVTVGVAIGGAAVPIRVSMANRPTLRELLRRVGDAVRNPSTHFDGEVGPLQVLLDMNASSLQPLPVDLWIHFEADRLDGWLGFDDRLFRRETAQHIVGHFANLLGRASEAPDVPIDSLRVETYERLLGQQAAWNQTKRALPHAARLVHEAIVERARLLPDAIAVMAAGDTLTYGKLEQQSRALARILREHGANPEICVGLFAHPSIGAVVAVLAILRAGSTYVPLDPGYPAERLELMVSDAGVHTVLVEPGAIVAFPPQVRVIELTAELFAGDEPLDVMVQPQNLAYIMYTSGSTGVPKGVAISHTAMRNTIAWMQDAYPLRPGDVVAHKTSISFTDSIWELLWPPLIGAQIAVISENDRRFPRRLLQALRQYEVAVTQFVPAQMRLFLDEVERAGEVDPLPSLRWVFNGGEALPPSLPREWFRHFPRTRIANAYGMTESAIYGTNYVVEPAEHESVVLVGHPIANERAYVLDHDLQPCPPLCIGEIHLAGESLARGYHGRPDVTADCFVPDPFGPPGSRMYRTGDLGRRLPTGEILCLGRVDRQVKVRGARVELGEVEAALALHPAVRQGVVVARRTGTDCQLDAFYTWRGSDPGPRALLRFLSGKLPSFMLPVSFVAVEALPLTVNGKIDRDRLQREAHNCADDR
jgi:amino acid adenylation domain-containing protein